MLGRGRIRDILGRIRDILGCIRSTRDVLGYVRQGGNIRMCSDRY
jgi:hypothetical protein